MLFLQYKSCDAYDKEKNCCVPRLIGDDCNIMATISEEQKYAAAWDQKNL